MFVVAPRVRNSREAVYKYLLISGKIFWKDGLFEKEDSPEGIAVVADINPIAALTVARLFISARWLSVPSEDKKGRGLALPF